MDRRTTASCLLLALLFLGHVAQSGWAGGAPRLSVAVLAPLSAGATREGLMVLDGAQMALPSEGLSLVSVDHRGEVDRAARLSRDMVEKGEIDVAILAGPRAVVMASAPLFQWGRLPLIVLDCEDEGLADVGELIFRMSRAGDGDGLQAARFVVESLGETAPGSVRQASLSEREPKWPDREAVRFEKAVLDSGGKLAVSASFSRIDPERTGLFERLGAFPVGVFHISARAREGWPLVEQMWRAGLSATLVVPGSWLREGEGRPGGPPLSEVYVLTPFEPRSPRETVRRFVENFERAHDVVPSRMAALAHDAIRIVAKAAEASPERPLSERLRAVSLPPGVSGFEGFDETGGPRRLLEVVRLTAEGREHVETLEP